MLKETMAEVENAEQDARRTGEQRRCLKWRSNPPRRLCVAVDSLRTGQKLEDTLLLDDQHRVNITTTCLCHCRLK